ncbi:hypothetical protein LINPERHAP2_LOCUS33235 [Linum perenne]
MELALFVFVQVHCPGTMARVSGESSRDYRVWTKEEEKMLVTCMRELVEGRHVEKGQFQASSLKALEKMTRTRMESCQLLAVSHVKSKVCYFKDKFAAMLELKRASGFGWDDTRGCVVADDVIFAGRVKSHPKASGLNNKPLSYWDDLSFIFGAEMATGADVVQLGDALSKVLMGRRSSDFVDVHAEQDFIDKGVDMHTTLLKGTEAEISSKPVTVKGVEGGASSGTKRSRQMFWDKEHTRIANSMESVSENIARFVTNYCIEGDLAVKRQYLYQELASFPGLTPYQRTRIMRHLNRDDGDASTYFQLPSQEEKLAFIWTLLK